jgi:ATP-binding cassette subfamily B multidrug efflux pump
MSAASKSLWSEFAGLKRLWPYLRHNRRLVFTAIALIPLISALQMALPLTLQQTIDKGVIAKNTDMLAVGALIYLAAVIGEYIARASQSVTTALAVHRMIRDLRAKLVRHVMGLGASYHDRSLSGTLVTRATSDFDNLSESLNMGVLTSIVDLAVLVGCVVGMFLLDAKLALFAILILPIVAVIVHRFSKALKSAMLKARVKIAALNAYTQECLYGVSTIKLLTGEPAATKRYDKLNVEFRDAQMGSVWLDALMFAVLDGIASITVGLALYAVVSGIPGLVPSGAEAISAGVLVAFVQYIQQLFEPLKHLGNKMAMLQGAFTSIDRIFGVLELREQVGGDAPVGQLSGAVAFQDVRFRYRQADGPGKPAAPVLKGVSFDLAAGESLAIVGATGSGKSTIVKLLAKLYDGYDGRITLDGQDLRQIDPVALRRRIAIVPQDIALFDGTVAFNIGLGAEGISREQIEASAKAIGADLFIDELPGRYDFEIREQGTNLSQGQRQLIAFARAMVKDPALVILDEATSSIDPESEAMVQRAISNLLKGRSVIVIAHRLSTVRQCDQILVLEHGEVLERGRHEGLLASQGAYYRLHGALS